MSGKIMTMPTKLFLPPNLSYRCYRDHEGLGITLIFTELLKEISQSSFFRSPLVMLKRHKISVLLSQAFPAAQEKVSRDFIHK